MKRNLLIISILTISIYVFGQDNFVKGYIITNTNDTVFGLVDFRSNYLNSVVCKFKENEKSATQSFNPGEIYAFRFQDEGKYYVTRTVTIGENTMTVFWSILCRR